MRNTIMRTVVLALLIYALVSFAGLLRTLERAVERQTEIQREIDVLRRSNTVLKSKIENASSADSIEAIARERLALVMPGEKIFYFTIDGE